MGKDIIFSGSSVTDTNMNIYKRFELGYACYILSVNQDIMIECIA